MNNTASRPRFSMTLAIGLAMAAGLALGPVLGKDAVPLGEISKLVIQLIKAAATPLLFLAIVQAIARTEVGGKGASRLIGFAFFNAVIALSIGLLFSNVFQPGAAMQGVVAAPSTEQLAAYAGKKVEFIKTLASYVPANVLSPFVENQVISIVLLALLFGAGLRVARRDPEHAVGAGVLLDAVGGGLRVMEVVLGWVILLVPFAVFGSVARTVGEYGFAPLKGLAAYVAIGLAVLAAQVLLTYQLWIVAYAKISLAKFWSIAKDPVVYAIGANSSLATLPITLRALDRLGVRKESAALGACVGTNLNNDGILLYEGMAVLFVAQASGIHLDLGQQLLAAGTAVVAAMGVAGVPEAGFISLALVINTVGLPIEILPLLLTVDWIVARGRSAVNVLSDMVLSILIDGPRPRPA